jgi:hypothetical protein
MKRSLSLAAMLSLYFFQATEMTAQQTKQDSIDSRIRKEYRIDTLQNIYLHVLTEKNSYPFFC